MRMRRWIVGLMFIAVFTMIATAAFAVYYQGVTPTYAYVTINSSCLFVGEKATFQFHFGGINACRYEYKIWYYASSPQNQFGIVEEGSTTNNYHSFTPTQSDRQYGIAVTAYDEDDHFVRMKSSWFTTVSRSNESVLSAARRVINELITPDMTDMEKCIVLHNWVCANNSYGKSNRDQKPESVFFDHGGVCNGIAEAFQILAEECGIRCILPGKASMPGNEVPHKWCLVRIDGKWYHLDCTWDDPGTDDYISYRFFLFTDAFANATEHFCNQVGEEYANELMIPREANTDPKLTIQSQDQLAGLEALLPDTEKTIDEICLWLEFAEGNTSNVDYSDTVRRAAETKYATQGYVVDVKRYSPELNGQLYYIKINHNMIAYGSVSENVSWCLTGDSVLYIFGAGPIPHYNCPQGLFAPWHDYANQIKRLVILPGITSIGDWAFADCTLLEQVDIAPSVTNIGEGAFYNCPKLDQISNSGDSSSHFQIPIEGHNSVLINHILNNLDDYKTFVLPRGVRQIEDGAFSGTAAQIIIIPEDCILTYFDSSDMPDLQYVINYSNRKVEVPEGVTLINYNDYQNQTIKVGDIVQMGHYQQTTAGNDRTPIEWRVLAIRYGRALLISRYALFTAKFHSSFSRVSWASCDLREYLNGSFLVDAFSASEIQLIKQNKSEQNTYDYIFLLSIGEANSYFANNADRRCTPTPYAAQRATTRTYDGQLCCWWWLRTMAYDARLADGVYWDGTYDYAHVNTDGYSWACVRPAMWIDLKGN